MLINSRVGYRFEASSEGRCTDTIASIVNTHPYSCLPVAENKTLRNVTERNFMFQTISNATFSVDTFFFIRYVGARSSITGLKTGRMIKTEDTHKV
jgi:hypothetical protein